jgi:histidinol-phosphate/aromatic aminotransferase/cobyric acid decarboxylase-like protein
VDPRSVSNVETVPHGGVADPTLVDFSTAVNPDCPPGVAPVYEAALSAAGRYPLDDHAEFRTAVADYLGCAPRAVVPAAGCHDALRLALGVTVEKGESVLVPEPAPGEYAREVTLRGAEVAVHPRGDLLSADPAPHAAVIVSNPNNPVGAAYPDADLRAYAEHCREVNTTLLLDETLLGFTDRPSLAGTPGTLVVRSLTPLFGLPGLRAAAVVCDEARRDPVERARTTGSLSTPAVDVTTHCLDQAEFLRTTRERTREERDRLTRALRGAGFGVLESDSNLLCVRSDRVEDLLDATRARGMAIRDARTFPGLDSHVRITVRRPDENDRLLDAFRSLSR